MGLVYRLVSSSSRGWGDGVKEGIVILSRCKYYFFREHENEQTKSNIFSIGQDLILLVGWVDVVTVLLFKWSLATEGQTFKHSDKPAAAPLVYMWSLFRGLSRR